MNKQSPLAHHSNQKVTIKRGVSKEEEKKKHMKERRWYEVTKKGRQSTTHTHTKSHSYKRRERES